MNTHHTIKPFVLGAAAALAIGLGSVGATTTVHAAPNTGLNDPTSSEWRPGYRRCWRYLHRYRITGDWYWLRRYRRCVRYWW